MVFPPTTRIVEGEIVGSKTTKRVSLTNNNFFDKYHLLIIIKKEH